MNKLLLVDGVHLQGSYRAKALAYVFLMALLAAAILQCRIWRALKESGETVTLDGKRVTDRPTIVAILEPLSKPHVIIIEQHDGCLGVYRKTATTQL